MPELALTDAVPLVTAFGFIVAYVLARNTQLIIAPLLHVVAGALGWIPFVGGWVQKGVDHVLSYLNELVVSLRAGASWWWQVFLWSVQETVNVTEETFGYVETSLRHLVGTALPGAFENLYADAAAMSAAAEAEAAAASRLAWSNLTRAEHYTDGVAAVALATAEHYTDRAVTELHAYVGRELATAKHAIETDIGTAKRAAITAAETYTDQVRRAIEAELGSAVAGVESELGSAVSRLNASIATVSDSLGAELTAAESELTSRIASTSAELEAQLATAERTLEAGIAAASATASADLHSAVGELESAIAGVRSTADTIAADVTAAETAAAGELEHVAGLGADDLRRLLDSLDLSKLTEFGAGVVLLRALVSALEAETGLGSRECRSKVKGICGVDPSRWSSLLASLAAIGIAFDFRELVRFAEEIAPPALELVRKAA